VQATGAATQGHSVVTANAFDRSLLDRKDHPVTLLQIDNLRALQRFADADIADDVIALAMNGLQRGLGLLRCAVFQLGKFEAALAVELVFDDVFGRLGHGHTCLSADWGVTQLNFELERRMILIE